MRSIWELKPFIEILQDENEPIFFSKWNELKEIIDVLIIPYVPSIKIQSVDCTLTDMWSEWTRLLIQLENNSSPLAQNILTCLNGREYVIKNPTVFAALFLDPRYKTILQEGERQIAKCELLSLHSKLQRKKSNNIVQNHNIDEIELLLMSAEIRDERHQSNDEENDFNGIQEELEKFMRTRRMNKEIPVLSFWKENKAKSTHL